MKATIFPPAPVEATVVVEMTRSEALEIRGHLGAHGLCRALSSLRDVLNGTY